MVFKKKEFKLKDGRKAVLHTPSEDDAEDMLQFIVKASSETDFLMRFPEELAEVTLDQERAFIQESYNLFCRWHDCRKLSDFFLY